MLTYRQGSKGEMVRQIQKALAGAGLRVIVDGHYGPITTEAVREYQRKHGLKADGIVGPATLALLIPSRWRRSRRTITELIVHCTATPEGKDYTVADIRRWHTLPVSKGGRGWSDIGYHYIVDRYGHVHEGRNVDIIGAHCTGHNAHSIGIVYVGGCERNGKTPKDTRTLAQKAALITLLTELRTLYPSASIHGHRDFAAKACPSFDATAEYKDI